MDRHIRTLDVEKENMEEEKRDLLRILDRYDLPIGAEFSDGSPDGEDSRGSYSVLSQGDGCQASTLGEVRHLFNPPATYTCRKHTMQSMR